MKKTPSAVQYQTEFSRACSYNLSILSRPPALLLESTLSIKSKACAVARILDLDPIALNFALCEHSQSVIFKVSVSAGSALYKLHFTVEEPRLFPFFI